MAFGRPKSELGGRRGAEANARCLDEYFKRKGEDVEVVPIFVGIEFISRKPKVGDSV